ncbi:transcriptional regulator, AraC family [Arcobacter nitrofigilis DSM 7299]|uniref:Transcriptional regulator, AraC family n=1 Tax=Arcobacter nitrofigilis (strain ATCC 33309 / DSM 7299 / CCUG 15893 / LMG 7604 / NCTC 12251 / CI) TaxID=572480 RepID=D5UZI2_ARCNC|nr:helix-turn-helix domain-containing protein [Arcobacter nitrofigilis]ADG92219.1 transcriptional regulator, AraC family [Arcobacter nitrofigilis DSM 7299]
MNTLIKVNYIDLFDIVKKTKNPFSRETYISKIKKEYGEGFSIFYDMGNGIGLFVRKFIPKKNLLLYEESEVPGACLIFNFGSNINFKYKDKKEHILRKNHFFLELASNKFYCETPLKKDEPFSYIFIGIKKNLFLKLAHPITDIEQYMQLTFEQSYFILKDLQIDALQLELSTDFKDENSFEDILKSIYLESKITNLLHYTIEKISKSLSSSSSIILKKDRVLSLERAKEIIMNNYNSKLSIKTIAYKSAINECYLKKDFKEYYGMTILEMIQKRRLEVAKKLLKENLSVKEVSIKIGYNNASYFSKLFFDNFQISPNDYRKELNNF